MSTKLLTETADYDTPGSWDSASQGWPEIHDPKMAVRRFVIRHEKIVPYGAYVTVGEKLRIHPHFFDALISALAAIETVAVEVGSKGGAAAVIDAKYDDVLIPFAHLMARELHANASKGDRPGWLKMSSATGMLEIYHHAAKLQKAVKNGEGDRIIEYAADVANMAMMLLDVCGGLAVETVTHPAERAAVPDAMTIPQRTEAKSFDEAYGNDVADGWNACREEMLTAAPQPPEGERVVPEGFALVPVEMCISKHALEEISSTCGGHDEAVDIDDRWCEGIAWIGDIEEDDGSKRYGLHIMNADYPEFGSVTLAEFAAPTLAGKEQAHG